MVEGFVLFAAGEDDDFCFDVVMGEVVAEGFGVMLLHVGVHDHETARVFDLAR